MNTNLLLKSKTENENLLDIILLIIVFIYGILITFLNQISGTINNLYIILISLLIIISKFRFSQVSQIKVLLACSMVGIDYPLMIIPLTIYIIFLFNKKYFKLKKPIFITIIFISYAFCIYIANLIVTSNILSFPLWLMSFGSGLLLFIYYSKLNYSEKDLSNIFYFFVKLILLQLLLVFIQLLKHGKIEQGDWGIGSLNNAHLVGFYLSILLIYCLKPFWIRFLPLDRDKMYFKDFLKLFMWLFLLVPFLILCDAKVFYGLVLLSVGLFFIGFIIWFVLKNNLFIKKKNKFIFLGCLLFVILLSISPAIFNFYGSHFSKSDFTLSDTIDNYTVNEKSNQKYILYQRVFKDFYVNEGFPIYILGTGPGTFDSRASNSRAYDTLYKKGGPKIPEFISPYSSDYTKKYLADLYTENIALSTGGRSSLLSIPFAGIASLKAELGIIGLFLFLFICYSSIYIISKELIIKNKNPAIGFVLSVWWGFLPFAMVFDNIQEDPHFVIPLYLLTAVSLSYKKEEEIV